MYVYTCIFTSSPTINFVEGTNILIPVSFITLTFTIPLEYKRERERERESLREIVKQTMICIYKKIRKQIRNQKIAIK